MTEREQAVKLIEDLKEAKGEWYLENISKVLIKEQIEAEATYFIHNILKEFVYTDINNCAGKWAERRRAYWNNVLDEVVKIL
jgi:hypothetical protein